jgi:hypothetical protein
MAKVFIVAVVILVILFVVGAGCGITQKSDKDSKSSNYEGFVETLQFNKPQAVGDGDFIKSSITPTACYLNREFTIAKGGSCTVRVKDSNSNIRQLRVKLTQGTTLELASLPNNTRRNLPGKLEISLSFNPNAKNARNLDFYEEGGTLTLTCTLSTETTCKARLES